MPAEADAAPTAPVAPRPRIVYWCQSLAPDTESGHPVRADEYLSHKSETKRRRPRGGGGGEGGGGGGETGGGGGGGGGGEELKAAGSRDRWRAGTKDIIELERKG